MGTKLNFKTIKQIHSYKYLVENELDSINFLIERYTNKYNLNLYPDFQRGHVWSEDQQIKFIEYILKNGKLFSPIIFNHPNWMGNFKGNMVIVDGLQRITAIQKFLNNDLKIFGGYSLNNIENCHLRKYTIPIAINDLKSKEEVAIDIINKIITIPITNISIIPFSDFIVFYLLSFIYSYF